MKYRIEDLFDTERIGEQAISHDDRKILYSSNKSGTFNAYICSIDGSDENQMTHFDNHSVHTVSFLPQSYSFLFMSDHGGDEKNHIYLCDEEGHISELTPSEGVTSQFLVWNHDGLSFLYSSNQQDAKFLDLYEMDMSTMTSSLLFQNNHALEFGCISRDKSKIALKKIHSTSRSEIWLYDVNRNALQTILAAEENIIYDPRTFSPDGKQLLFLTDEIHEFTYLRSYELATGQIATVHQENWDIWYAFYSYSG